ncbi:MAG: pyridoxamine 5'-phosphate oxidase family protein [bacterium]|nr:pyridoxamine 5'-phosphate oxidase family protein [bacterium]
MDKQGDSKAVIKEKILEIYRSNDAATIATTGGEYSPWIIGAYFANDDLKMYLFIDTLGKSMANMKVNNSVAVSISKNDATQDFLQGIGEIIILDGSEEAGIRKMLTEKMSWFKTYTPVTPVRIDIRKFYVSSFKDGWFPAKELEA